MDISALGGTAMAEQAKMVYNVACMKMAQHSENVAQYLILDTVEISAEAMEKYMAEKRAEV
jgi:hypothetical protein